MKRSKILAIAAIALVLVCLSVADKEPGAEPSSKEIRWEYSMYWPTKKDNPSMNQIMQMLNKKGDQGWELISINAHNGSWLRTACYVFKRPK